MKKTVKTLHIFKQPRFFTAFFNYRVFCLFVAMYIIIPRFFFLWNLWSQLISFGLFWFIPKTHKWNLFYSIYTYVKVLWLYDLIFIIRLASIICESYVLCVCRKASAGTGHFPSWGKGNRVIHRIRIFSKHTFSHAAWKTCFFRTFWTNRDTYLLGNKPQTLPVPDRKSFEKTTTKKRDLFK